MKFTVNTITSAALSSNSKGWNALDSITHQVAGDTAYVQQTNRWYRWYPDSSATPDGLMVVEPIGQPTGAGRWFREGPPGSSSPYPGQNSNLSPTPYVFQTSVTLAGGTPTEVESVALPAEAGDLWPRRCAILVTLPTNITVTAQANVDTVGARGQILTLSTLFRAATGNLGAGAQPITVYLFPL